MWSLDQVSLHNKPTDCWVIIKNHVYVAIFFHFPPHTLTQLLRTLPISSKVRGHFMLGATSNQSPEHPGGSKIILKYAGHDATSAYEPIHPPDALEKNLPSSKHLGPLNASAAQSVANDQQSRKKTKDELRVEQALLQRPPLARILNLADMEVQSPVLPLTHTLTLITGGRQKGLIAQGRSILFLRRRRPYQ